MNIRILAATLATTLAAPMVLAQSEPPGTTSDEPARTGLAKPPVLFHFAGYADATYVNARGDAGSSGNLTFAPIFHLQFGDRFFIEAELELEADDRGQTEAALEYATVNWLLNDHAALVVGKFLSPVGYFFQNLHPSWINRMASVPAGFGHGGAAPLTDVGVQLRGGKTFAGGNHVNYALYHANGPRLGLEVEEMEEEGGEAGHDEEGPEFALDLDVEGSIRDPDGKRVTGVRMGWMPIPTLELGASLARGDVILDADGMGEGPEPSRSYRVDGVDAAWRPTKALELRGEWIRQQVGRAPGSAIPEQATWRAWYVQGAYRFGSERWETVLRYGDSVSPHGESTFEQMAVGLNHLFRPNAQLKLSWEFNDGANAQAAADRLLLQFAYGF
jgi:hypothetical protein